MDSQIMKNNGAHTIRQGAEADIFWLKRCPERIAGTETFSFFTMFLTYTARQGVCKERLF